MLIERDWIATTWTPRAVPGLTWREMNGAFVVSVAGSERTHVVNQTGVLLLELANGQHTVDEMVRVLREAFGLAQDPDAQVRHFLSRAVQAGLVE